MKRKISFIGLSLICFMSFPSHAVLLSNQTQTPSMPVADIEVEDEDGVIFDFDSPGIEDLVGDWTYNEYVSPYRYTIPEGAQAIYSSSWIGENLDISEGADRKSFYNLTMQIGGEEPFNHVRGLDIAGGVWIKLSDEIKQAIPKFSGLSFDVYLEAEDVFDELTIELKDGDEIITQFIYSVEDLKNGEWQTLAVPVNFDAQEIEDLTLVVGLRGVYSEEEQNVFLAIDDVKLDTSEDFYFESQQNKRSDYFTYGIYEDMVEQLNSSEPGERAAAVIYLGDNVPSCQDEVIRLNVAKALKPLLDDGVIPLISSGITDIRVKAITALAKIVPTLTDDEYKKELADYMLSSRFIDNREISIQKITMVNMDKIIEYVPKTRMVSIAKSVLAKFVDRRNDNLLDEIGGREYYLWRSSLLDALSSFFPDKLEDSKLELEIIDAILSMSWVDMEHLSSSSFESIFSALVSKQDSQLNVEISRKIIMNQGLSNIYWLGSILKEEIIPNLGSDEQKVLIEIISECRFFTPESKFSFNNPTILVAIADNAANNDVRDELSALIVAYLEAPHVDMRNNRVVGLVDALKLCKHSLSDAEKDSYVKDVLIKRLLTPRTENKRDTLRLLASGFNELSNSDKIKICTAIEDAILNTTTLRDQYLINNNLECAIEILAELIPQLTDESEKIKFTEDIVGFIGSNYINIARTAIWAVVNMCIPNIVDENKKIELSEKVISLVKSGNLDKRTTAYNAIKELMPMFENEEFRLYMVETLWIYGFTDNDDLARVLAYQYFDDILPMLSEKENEVVAQMLISFLESDKPVVKIKAIDCLGDVAVNIENNEIKVGIIEVLKGYLNDITAHETYWSKWQHLPRELTAGLMAKASISNILRSLDEDSKISVVSNMVKLLAQEDMQVIAQVLKILDIYMVNNEILMEDKKLLIDNCISLLGNFGRVKSEYQHSDTIQEVVAIVLGDLLEEATSEQVVKLNLATVESLSNKEAYEDSLRYVSSYIFPFLTDENKANLVNSLVAIIPDLEREDSYVSSGSDIPWNNANNLFNNILYHSNDYIAYFSEEEKNAIVDLIFEAYEYKGDEDDISRNLKYLLPHLPLEQLSNIRIRFQGIIIELQNSDSDKKNIDYRISVLKDLLEEIHN
ncbi:MAG: hypothetical protein P9M06_03885 [Candidatus Saelkia tenebricola]|nr:hypothetical protein [Candidatus Saelkia tenebricola]